MTDDPAELPELRGLPAIDVDPASADRIAARARAVVGRGESPWRFVEPLLVTAFTTTYLVWTVMKMIEVFR